MFRAAIRVLKPLALAALVALPALAWSGAASADAVPLRIGYQKYGTLVLLAERHTLEPKLGSAATVTWTEFPGGPQLLEALAAGSIDFGITGETPPVFAEAAHIPIVYVGVEPPAPKGEAILVAKDSPIRTLADLKGKRIALNKGSNVHYLLVQALAKGGVGIDDITPIYLAPADGRAAFQRGAVDAWAIWDPYFAAGQAATDARVLADGTGLAPNRQFFLATRSFVTQHPDIVKAILASVKDTDAWALAHPGDTVTLLAKHTGIPASILKDPVARLTYGVQPMDAQAIADQQKIADTFYRLKLIPRPVKIQDALWDAHS
jgi:sulfonate transport system substrate-binding protein